MQKIYSRINWENFPSEKTAVNESNLNKMDLAIDNLDDRVVAMDASKVDLTKANELVEAILWDESNGTLTVVKMNGSRAVIDTKLEKLAVNFTYNPQTQQLVIALDDGTVQNVDLSSLITEYEFLDSDTIAFEIVDGKVKAIVKNGSITENHLAPEYLAEIRTQVGRAEMSAKSADASEKNAASSSALAKSYAVGGTGTRDGEDTDNAKYYAEQAKNASDVGALSEIVEKHISNKTIHMTESEHDVVSKLGESAEGTLTFNGKDVIGSTITVDDALSSTSTNPVQNKVVTSNLTNLKYGEVAGGKNLIDFSKVIKGYELDTGNLKVNANWYVTDYIKVKPNTTYTLSGTSSTYFDEFTIDKTLIRPNNASTFTTGSNTYYLRFNSIIDGYATPQLEEGTTVTSYEPYIQSVKMLNVDVAELKAEVANKLDKDNVVNNQTTTEAGFALDARQANPNIDGTLAKQVADLNGSLNDITFANEVIIDPLDINNLKNKLYMTNITTKNLPDGCDYGFLFVVGADNNKWRLLIFIPTSLQGIYINFYNAYAVPAGWHGWNKIG